MIMILMAQNSLKTHGKIHNDRIEILADHGQERHGF